MTDPIRHFRAFCLSALRAATSGDRRYHLWMGTLSAIMLVGGYAYIYQANHGLVVLGSNLNQALSLTHEAETLAMIYLRALGAGSPVMLSDAEMRTICEKFKAYGYGPVGGSH